MVKDGHTRSLQAKVRVGRRRQPVERSSRPRLKLPCDDEKIELWDFRVFDSYIYNRTT